MVIPCYRSAPLARDAVAPVARALEGAGWSWELIIVDDGGGDFRPGEFDTHPHVRLRRFPMNRGKGAAVRDGMLAARGVARVFTDVDVPFGTAPIVDVARRLLDGSAPVVIGDRRIPGSDYHLRLGWGRRVASLAFTWFVGSLVTDGLYDTQCGLKGLRGDVVEALFPALVVDRFAFDVELVYAALQLGLRIDRVPVRLLRNETSSVRLPRDAVRAALDLARIRWQAARGAYRAVRPGGAAADPRVIAP